MLDAHEGMADALLATGRHGDVVDTLRSLVAAHPLRERFHAQLMIALYRCGRQSEALRAYRHAREVLLDELGLDPGLSCSCSNGPSCVTTPRSPHRSGSCRPPPPAPCRCP